MKVRCKAIRWPPEDSGSSASADQSVWPRLEVGQLYTVMGMSFGIACSEPITIEIPDECYVFDAPLCLFDIVDERPSRYWRARRFGEYGLHLWPEAFYIDCFHDRLSDFDAELAPIYRELRARMESEFD